MCYALLTLFLAFPASAQDTVDWSGTGCRMVMTPDKPHIAEITCHNYLTGGVTDNEGAVAVGGLVVGIIATKESEYTPAIHSRSPRHPPTISAFRRYALTASGIAEVVSPGLVIGCQWVALI